MKKLMASCMGVALLLAGPAPVSAQPDSAAYESRIIGLINAQRANAGLPPLADAHTLDAAAQAYTDVLAQGGCFDHTCGPVPQLGDRLGNAGYAGWRVVAENIAAGYPSPEAVVAGWMASPGHRANILSPEYADVGVGFTSGAGQYGTYWTVDFGARVND